MRSRRLLGIVFALSAIGTAHLGGPLVLEARANDARDAGVMTSASPPPASREMRGGDAACRIGIDALRGAAEALLVDVRRSDAGVRVPGALQLSLTQLKVDPVVSASSLVVLIGDGKDTMRLLQRCVGLRAQGLRQLRVLDGGLPAWHRSGGATAGAMASLEQPLRLSPSELNSLIRQGETTLIFAGLAPSPAWDELPNRKLQVPSTEVPSTVLGRIAHATDTIVVILPDGGDPYPWQAAALAMSRGDPLFFIGKASRYDDYLHQLASIATHANLPLPGRCEQGG